MENTVKLGQLTAHRPSSPAISAFLNGKFVIAGTGHRPDKLGGYGTSHLAGPEAVLIALATEYLLRLKPDVVISGMALGWDMALAQAAVNLKLPLLAAVPFPQQASRWPSASQARHHALLTSAAFIVCVSSDQLADADIKAAMNWRNEFMVDHAHLILACFDGSAGGTRNCIDDATAQGKQIVNTYTNWQERTAAPIVNTTAPCRQVNHPEYGKGSVKNETTLRGQSALIVDFADRTAVILAAGVNPCTAR